MADGHRCARTTLTARINALEREITTMGEAGRAGARTPLSAVAIPVSASTASNRVMCVNAGSVMGRIPVERVC